MYVDQGSADPGGKYISCPRVDPVEENPIRLVIVTLRALIHYF